MYENTNSDNTNIDNIDIDNIDNLITEEPQPPKKKKKVLPIVIAVVLVVALLLGCTGCLGVGAVVSLFVPGFNLFKMTDKVESDHNNTVSRWENAVIGDRSALEISEENSYYASYWDEESQSEFVPPVENAYSVGDKVFFGKYEQDDNIFNGKEDIQWIVVDVSGSQCLLVSEYILDEVNYHNSNTAVDWDSSDIKAWLNDDFKYSAFDSDERNMIENTSWGDIFLLSENEAAYYFSSQAKRCTGATDYAIDEGVYVDDDGYCRWWLRDSGGSADRASYVMVTGEINSEGHDVAHGRVGVRPALWVDLSK